MWMTPKNDNIEIMMDGETGEIIEQCFETLLQRYQEGLGESMRESPFFCIAYYFINFIK